MAIEERPDGIVVSDNSAGLTKLMLAVTALFLGVAVYDVFIGARGTKRLVGLLGAAGTCALIAVAFLEVAWFHFARDARIVTWRRRWALRERSGAMPFASIDLVLVERPLGDDGTPSRRITLKTKNGESIPITVGYRPDADGAVLQIATHLQNVKALIAAGRTIDAIRVVREEEGLSLVDAKRRVEELRLQ